MPSSTKSWKLEINIARDTQGYVVSGFRTLEHGIALLLSLPEGGDGRWLADLQALYPITPASDVGNGSLSCTTSIAFTSSGLERMGLPPSALASFSDPFRQGMFQEDRLRRLGDRRDGKWQCTVRDGGPLWSGGLDQEPKRRGIGAHDVDSVGRKTLDDREEDPWPQTFADVLLVVYTRSVDAARRAAAEVEQALGAHDVRIVRQLDVSLDPNKNAFSREHFGFADGISQPLPFDPGGAVLRDGKLLDTPDPVHGVPLGEFLIGYENGHQEVAPGPVVPGEPHGRGGNSAKPTLLSEHEHARGFHDIGKNGSYLVVRELYQDVAAFWGAMEEATKLIRDANPDSDHITADWLAEKVVGRSIDGHMLHPTGALEPRPDGSPDNDVSFWDNDLDGVGCPLGSHVRRANPRDALAPFPQMKDTLLNAANNHRILRRGRKYGIRSADRTTPDYADRGLLFMCLNTDIARQFEFIQQTWLMNKDFGTLFEETDPLVGPDGWMTISQTGLRRRVPVKTFVQMVGGAYFFLPGMTALRYLATL